MGNALTDIINEVKTLNASRQTAEQAPEAQAPSAPGETPVQPEASQPSPPIQDPGPPRFIAISFEASIAISNIGNVPLDPKESQEIIAICLRALARSMRMTFSTIATLHGIKTPKRTGLTAMAEGLSGEPPI